MLRVNKVTKRFGKKVANENVSLSLNPGEIGILLGPNGAGKSTAIKCILGLLRFEGEVTIGGHPAQSAEAKALLGYVPEFPCLYEMLTVKEHFEFIIRAYNLDRQKATNLVADLMDRFRLTDMLDTLCKDLSKGMQQKVQFIITVLHKPQLLIFDEPFSGFDPVNAELLKREILTLRDAGHTVIYSTHNMASVEDVCDEIALINRSHVVLTGNVHEVKQRFRTGLYEVIITDGNISDEPEKFCIVEASECDGLRRFVLQKNPALSNSDLASLIARHAEIRSFAEQLPSMNNIFLQVVGGIQE